MTDNELQQSLSRVQEAMERLNEQFLAKVETLERQGTDAAQIKRLTEGARAMKDSSRLYLDWAHHYAKEVGKVEHGDGVDESFLDEGSGFEGLEFR
ncbi:MAG: hypothetical protein AB1515_03925 [Nitrospirota bacterium]